MAIREAAPLNAITSAVISAAIEVHKTLGPGLFESAYLACLAHDLLSSGHGIELQKAIPLDYRGIRLDAAYRADLIVDEAVIVEIKALEALSRHHTRQLRTYLRLSQLKVGLLLNFGAETMAAGIRRVVNNFPDGAEPIAHHDTDVVTEVQPNRDKPR